MGLIQAALQGLGTVFADQWKEYFQCDSMSNDILIKKGVKVTAGNNKGSTDIISNGSAIAVDEGQAALIVEDGKIVDFTTEPGRFTWDSSTEPSCFCGGFFKGLLESFKKVGTRFTYGGDTAKTQRVYYVNLKEIMGNKFGTSTSVIYDDPYYKTALYLRYFGQYSFRICDPLIFFSALSGSVSDTYTRASLESLCTDEFLTALDTALALCSNEGYKFSELPKRQREISKFMSETLDEEWRARRGMILEAVALTKVTPDDRSRARIEEFDTNVMHSSRDAMAGGLAYAQMQAMQNAAKNDAGAMTGFMGFGMAANATGGAATQSTLLSNAAEPNRPERQPEPAKQPEAPAEAKPAEGTWKCACGVENTGKFCSECGTPKPEEKKSWTCACGTENTGKFCSECGAPKPEEKKSWTCACGTENEGKFCSECGAKRPE